MKKASTAVTPDMSTAVRDLAAFLLLAVAVFLGVALVSYEPMDPSWNTAVEGPNIIVQNYGGLIGSHTADVLIQLFGYASYLIPIALLVVIGSMVFRPAWTRSSARWIGFAVWVASSALLLSLVERPAASSVPLGGAAGYWLKQVLVPNLGTAGAYLTAITGILIALVLTAGLTFTGSLALLRSTTAFPAWILRTSIPFGRWFREKGRDWLELGEREVEKGLEAIQRDAEPNLPDGLIKIAGEEVTPEEAPVIPITRPEPRKLQVVPKFHTMDDEPKEETPATRKVRLYKLPDPSILETVPPQELHIDRNELFQNAQILERKLKDFGVFGKVVEVQPGPVVTMYEFEPAPGVKVNQLTRLNDDLALALKALSVRIEPIPGKSVIGIEVANRDRQIVYLQEVLTNPVFTTSASHLTIALGKDISGTPVVADLRKMPHLLVAGATGSGKSVAVNSMILSILYKSTPDEVRMILVDPKMLELSFYEDIPHLLLPVVTDPRKSAAALRWAVTEMERRYRIMADIGVRNVEGYNKKVPKVLEGKAKTVKPPTDESEAPLLPGSEEAKRPAAEEHTGPIPYIVIVIDELADLMMVSSHEVEESIIRLAQMARAAGIHLLLATQRPSVDVLTGVIKANMPARISFQVSSKIDSRTILDANGAELLLGSGDMLFLPPGTSKLQRIHGAFVTDNEVKRVTDFWKGQGKPEYRHEILKIQEEQAQLESEGGNEDDAMYGQALNVVRTYRVASISLIQRKLRIGYNRAARIVERMEEEGLLAPGEVGKPREVIMSRLLGSPP